MMGSAYQITNDTSEFEMSQWQLLQQRMNSCSKEPTLPDAEVDKLLKSIFRDHALADYPDFVQYFKNNRYGKPMEDHVLRKAAASAAAHYHQVATNPPQKQPQPESQSHSHPFLSATRAVAQRSLEQARRGLFRYRAWRPRVQLYLLLSCPEYSPTALLLGFLFMAVIVLNTITFCIESVPAIEDTRLYHKLILVDYVCLGIFTTEFLARLLTCNDVGRFALKPMNWVDLAAIAPFLLELAVMGPNNQKASQTRILRLIRLLRVLRLLKAGSRFRNLQLVVDALVASADVMGMLVVLLLVLLVVAGSVVYYVEDILVKNSPLDSIPLTIYYMHVTLTTTGYGDYFAQSPWGRLVVGIFMLLCMVTVSLPIGVVGGNFSGLWTRYNALKAAIDRSICAWSTRADLRQKAGLHCAAVDDLLSVANKLKMGIEEGAEESDLPEGSDGGGPVWAALSAGGREGLRGVRDQLVAQQGRLQQLAMDGVGEDSCRLADVRESVWELRRRLGALGNHFAYLQALLALVPRVSSADVSIALEDLHSVHQALGAGSTRCIRQATRTRELLADLRAMRQVVKAEEELVYGGYDGAYDEDLGKGGVGVLMQK